MSVRYPGGILLAVAVLQLSSGALRSDVIDLRRPDPPRPAWSAAAREEMGESEYRFSEVAPGVHSAPNRFHGLRATAEAAGLRIVPRLDGASATAGGWEVRLSLASYGRTGAMRSLPAIAPRIDGERLVYHRGALTEWYRNDEKGLEQGFDLAAPPPGRATSGTVRIDLSLAGSLLGYPLGDTAIALRDSDGRDRLRIDRLHVVDAAGHELPSRFELAPGRIAILFDDAAALYPVTVDPTLGATSFGVAGSQMDDDFGFSIDTAGDVNGDGLSDFLVGSPRYDNGEADEGMAFLYMGAAAGPSSIAAWSFEPNQANARLGMSVSTAGDVNGDGFDDVIVGAPDWDNGQTDEGAAWIFLGGSGGLSATPAWMVEGNQSFCEFGRAVSGGGDVNGDGYDDVIVGAWTWSNDQVSEGRVFVYPGGPAGPSTTPISIVEGNQNSGYLGRNVAMAMDVNGDGYDDVLAGMVGYANGQPGEGGARLYLGSASGLVATPAWTGEGNQNNASYGYAVAGAGDTNGDGYADILIGAPDWDGPGTANEGAAYLYLGNATGAGSAAIWVGRIGQTGGGVGWSVGTAGDANGDGYADIVVGAPNIDLAVGADAGLIFVCFGGPSGPEAAASFFDYAPIAGWQLGQTVGTAGDVNGDGLSELLSTSPGADIFGGPQNVGLVRLYPPRTAPPSALSSFLSGGQAGAHLGEAVSSAGDVNGDGYSDLLVSAYLFDNGQVDEGRVYLYYGSASGISAAPGWTAEMNQAGAQFGHALAAAGDVNGDGYDDFLVGAAAWDNGQVDEGGAFLYYGSPTGPAATPGWSAEGNQASAWFGFEVAGAGDVNGDGYADLIAGAPLFDNGQMDEGRVEVYLGGPSGPTGPVWSAESNQANAWFGITAASAGDVNADGYSDIVVGAPLFDSTGAADAGMVSVWLGGPAGLAAKSVWDFRMLQAGAQLGRDVTSIGDFNGDGRSEILIGVPYDDFAGADTGSAIVVWGSSFLPSPGYSFLDGGQGGAFFGGRVSPAGDVNADGYSDFVISAYLHDNGEIDEGKSFLFLGNASGVLIGSSWQPEGNQTNAQMGVSVAAAGDVNGDGFGDVVFGAWNTTLSFFEEGTVLLYHGNEGLGRPQRAQQALPDGSRVMQRFAIPPGLPAFRARLRGRSAAGRTRVRLQVEAKTLSTPFSGTGQVTGNPTATGAPAIGGSTVALEALVSGLDPYTPYRWRARTLAANPRFPRTPWTFLPSNGAGEVDLKTRGCRDLDLDGWGSPGDATCPAGAAGDCSDSDATSYPGAPEVCDGVDNDCDTLVDEVPAPTGSSSIEFAYLGGLWWLQWLPDGESTMWDVVRGDLSPLQSSGGNFTLATTTCEANNSPFLANPMHDDPPIGQGYWYAMRRINCGGAGTYNSQSGDQVGARDAEINGAAGACP